MTLISFCPWPRIEWDDSKYCKQCQFITPFKNNKCVLCSFKNIKMDEFLK